MADDTRDRKSGVVDTALRDMKLEEEYGGQDTSLNGAYDAPTPEGMLRSRSSTPAMRKFTSQSPFKRSATQTPKSESESVAGEVIGGDITVTVEPGKAPKLSRKSSQKVVVPPRTLFNHMEDSTEEAVSVFQVIKDCIYGSKYMGYSEHDALDCDCSEEWSMYPRFAISTEC